MATSGIGSSNIDVNSIVSQLMAVEQRPLNVLAKKEASFQAKLSALGSIQGALATFQVSTFSLSNLSKFQALKANSSDISVISASATSIAPPGSYAIDVTSLAQSQKLVAAGQVSTTAAIGSGTATTLTFDFGTITGNTFNSGTGKYGTSLSASTTSGSATITVASTANLAVGASISGAGIPAGATIASITDATNFVISAPATATGTSVSLQANAVFTANGAGSKSITIDATNNSLQGIRDAINAANLGVTATIINDGSGTPYRLALANTASGSSNSLRINAAAGGDATVSALLAHDPSAVQNLSETVTAQNANFKVNGVAVSKTSNNVSDVIQGVTLNLQKTTSTPVSIDITRDTAAVQSAVGAFVKAYNDLSKVLKDSSSYDPATKKGAILLGDATVLSLQTQLRAALTTPVSHTGGTLTTLSQVGVSFQKDGTLALDSAKLDAALASSPSDVASLFATVGKPTDSLVSYSSSTAATKPGSYAVNVTALATQGGAAGNFDVNAGSNTIAANTTINVTLNGVIVSVALTAGSYSGTQLATMIQSAINGTATFAASGASVAATIDASGFLHLTSNQYGSTSSVSLSDATGTSVASFMGTTSTTIGTDVSGTINGLAATGLGQYLTSSSGNSTGLSVQVVGGVTGARGTVNFSQGYGYTLNTLANALLATDGPLASKKTGINSSIQDIGQQRTALNVRLTNLEKRYRAQFTALDTLLGNMNATSTYLTQQLASLSNLK